MENIDIEELAKQMRRDYNNAWRRKNKDKVKAYNRKHWLSRAAALAASGQSGKNNDDRDD